ncbi:MAG: TolC family protein [Desulfovibrio sp.]|nr:MULTISPECIES: TolC family protein [Desulfovibrio]MCI7373679.1 TolC family protein [Desulfovibrio piger]MDD6247662.1 TolC family protein [Desulfovibrio piger]MDY4672043.1 TolC family protein [Desulfovibrio sp.]MDY4939559.1 TolC family protein [Desulfovibrio sp.]MDY5394666.1 TolC family protein [Desulfovibrio sp.]
MLRPMLMESFSSFRGRCVRHLGTAVLCVVLLGSSQTSFAASAGRQDAVARQPVYTGQRSAETADRPVAGKSIGMSDAVEHALRFNPGLGAQEAESRSSEEGRKSARGAFGPRLGVSYSATKTESKRDPSATMGTKNPKMGVYSWGVEVTQPIFQGFRLLSTYQKAALQADSDKASLRKAELDMTEQVQTAFLEYLKAGENTRSMRDSLTRLREQLRIAQAYFEVGLSPRLDVLQAEVDVSEAESLLIEAENTQATALARLNTLLGFDATAVNTYTGTLKEVGFRYTLEQCLELAYRQRPDLYVAQKAVEIARKSQKEVQSDYYPQIEGYYSMTQSGNTPGMQRSGENGSHVTNWEVGAQATWNVFEWGTTYYADKQAGWQVTKMRYEQENLKLEVGYDIKSKYLAVQEARKRIAVAQNSVAQATEAYNVALARYHEHVGTNFDVLDASANLTSAQSSLTGAKADYLTALSQIYVAMGEYHPDLLREGGAARRK